jgi:hypothetical protein
MKEVEKNPLGKKLLNRFGSNLLAEVVPSC